ncbi:hypothetical protein CBS101457_001095 [Exobasidium rhododendri]|nr:hypothetical protein CBS101457_001095 [Exobasidium rhododendri]
MKTSSMYPALAAIAVANEVVTASRLTPAQARREAAVDPYGGASATILQHPADWSRDVYPIPVHSHNDYWRDAPVYDALSSGVRSIESDVWLNPDDNRLYVGHDPFALSSERTFQTLTLTPLQKAIDQANSANHVHANTTSSRFFTNLQKQSAPTVNESTPLVGYFSAGVGLSAPIQLLIDIKTDGDETFPFVLKELQHLADGGYLTQYNAKTNMTTPGPLLVIGTGNTPATTLAAMEKRFIFLDCPMGKLDTRLTANGTEYPYDPSLCGVASTNLISITDWEGVEDATDVQQDNLISAINQAHALNIKTRIWDTPNWPIFARNNVNRLLLELGSDWINADDLGAISGF